MKIFSRGIFFHYYSLNLYYELPMNSDYSKNVIQIFFSLKVSKFSQSFFLWNRYRNLGQIDIEGAFEDLLIFSTLMKN